MTARGKPAPSRSREARPGLSRGIKLPGKRRGGAPRGERAAISPAAAPDGAANGWCACRRSASPLWGGTWKGLLGIAWQSSDAYAPRERDRLSAPAEAGEGDHAKHGGGGV